MAFDSRVPVQSTIPTGGNYVSDRVPDIFVPNAGGKEGEALEDFGSNLLDTAATEQGQKAGASSQNNGLNPDNLDAPGFLGGNLTKYGQAYHQAALQAYTAKAGDNLDNTLFQLQKQYPTDTAGFADAFQSYKSDLIANAPPQLQNALSDHADQVYNGAYSRIWSNQIEAQRASSAGDITTRYNNLQDQLTSLVSANPSDPQIAGKMADLQSLSKLATTPLADGQATVSPERMALLQHNTQSEVVRATIQNQFTSAPGLAGKNQYLNDLVDGKQTSITFNGQTVPIGIDERDQMTSKLRQDLTLMKSGLDQDRADYTQNQLPAQVELLANGDPSVANFNPNDVANKLRALGASPQAIDDATKKLQIAQQMGQDKNQMSAMTLQQRQQFVQSQATAIQTNPSADPVSQSMRYIRLNQSQKILQDTGRAMQSDPYGLFAQENPTQYSKYDQNTDDGLKGLQAAMGQQYGLTNPPVAPKAMIDALTEKYNSAQTPDDKANIISQIQNNYPTLSGRILDSMKVSGPDRIAGTAMQQGDSTTANNILSAQTDLAQNKKLSPQLKDDAAQTAFTSRFGNDFGVDSTTRANMQQAYEGLFFQAAAKGDSNPDTTAANALLGLGSEQQINGNTYFMPKDANVGAIQKALSNLTSNPTSSGIVLPNGMTIPDFQQSLASGQYGLVAHDGGYVLMNRQGDTVFQGTPTAYQPLLIKKDGSISKFVSMQPEAANNVWTSPGLNPSTTEQGTFTPPGEIGAISAPPITGQFAKSPNDYATDAANQAIQQKLPVDTYARQLSNDPVQVARLNGLSHVIKGGDLSDSAIAYLKTVPAFQSLGQNQDAIRQLWSNPANRSRVTAGGVHMSPLEALSDLVQQNKPAQIPNMDGSTYVAP